MGAPDLVLLDVNETLSDLEPLRSRFTGVGAPGHLLETWFASVLRDGFALTTVGAPRPFPDVAAAVLRALLHPVPSLAVPVDQAVREVMDGLGELVVHPDVPAGLTALAEAGMRVVAFTNGGQASAEGLLERSGVSHLVERVLSVDDAGRWKPHPHAYGWALEQCGVPADRAALAAVHPWDVDGAQRAGLTGAWVDRRAAPYPEVFRTPDVQGGDLSAVATALRAR